MRRRFSQDAFRTKSSIGRIIINTTDYEKENKSRECDADMTLAMQYDVAAMAGVITVAKSVVDHEARIAELEKENALLKAKLNIN